MPGTWYAPNNTNNWHLVFGWSLSLKKSMFEVFQGSCTLRATLGSSHRKPHWGHHSRQTREPLENQPWRRRQAHPPRASLHLAYRVTAFSLRAVDKSFISGTYFSCLENGHKNLNYLEFSTKDLQKIDGCLVWAAHTVLKRIFKTKGVLCHHLYCVVFFFLI